MNPRLRLLPLAAAAAAAALAPPALAGPARGATCHGLPVTVAAHRGDVHGTPRADVIRLTAAGTVHSGAGDDIICGSPQPDRIYSGGGDDVVLGGGGADVIRSGTGRDHVYGEGGADHIHGGRHRDVLVPGSGWDVVSAGDLDSVEPGAYAVSVSLSAQAVQVLMMSGQRIGLSRPGNSPLVPLWTSFVPFMSNSVTFGDYAVYSTRGPLVPGAALFSEAQSPADLGSSWVFEQNGLFAPAQLAPAPESIQVMNAGGTEVLGLAQGYTVNGSSGMSPMSATATFPNQTVTLTPSPSVTVFPSGPAFPGMLLDGQAAGSVTVTPTPGRPTATVIWDDAAGGFIAAP